MPQDIEIGKEYKGMVAMRDSDDNAGYGWIWTGTPPGRQKRKYIKRVKMMTTLTMLDMDRNPPGRHRRNQAAGLSTHERFQT